MVTTKAANYRYLRFVDHQARWPYALYLLDSEGELVACGDPEILIRDD